MAVTYERARALVEHHLAGAARPRLFLDEYPDNPFSPPNEPVECAILDAQTIETERVLVFFYQSREFVDTGELSARLLGATPLLVLKDSGNIHVTGAAEPVDEHLRELEEWLGVTPLARRRSADVEVRLTMRPSSRGGRKFPVRSGYRPRFALRQDIVTSGQIEIIDRDELAPGEAGLARITFLDRASAPQSIWRGRTLRAQEGATFVAEAEVLHVFNPLLAVEAPLYDVLVGGKVIGRSPLEGRDPGMGVANGHFTPTFAFHEVEQVFALFADSQGDTGTTDEAKLDAYWAARAKLDLTLRSPEGITIPTEAIHIADYRAELEDDDACELSVFLKNPGFFRD